MALFELDVLIDHLRGNPGARQLTALNFDQVLVTRNAKHYLDKRLKLLVPDYSMKVTKEVEDGEEEQSGDD
jgi:hypothetical protein